VARLITGALAAKAKTNHFAMDRIKVQHLRQLNIKRLKVKRFIFVDVSKLQISHCAMGLTVSCNKP
jgi:hypothetical protein